MRAVKYRICKSISREATAGNFIIPKEFGPEFLFLSIHKERISKFCRFNLTFDGVFLPLLSRGGGRLILSTLFLLLKTIEKIHFWRKLVFSEGKNTICYRLDPIKWHKEIKLQRLLSTCRPNISTKICKVKKTIHSCKVRRGFYMVLILDC